MVEAFTIERRIPDKRVGPGHRQRRVGEDRHHRQLCRRVSHQGELAREHVWDKWARAGGALPYEVSRMEEALILAGRRFSANGHAAEGKALLAWAFCVGYGRPLRRLLRKRGWSRSTFYRAVDSGSARIAAYLNARGATVR